MNFFAKGILFFSALILFVPQITQAFVPGPTIISPLDQQRLGSATPIIKGLIARGTIAEVSVDGGKFLRAVIRKSSTPTYSFAFRPTKPLKPGDHKIEVRAKDPKGMESKKIALNIEVIPFSAPTLLKVDNLGWSGNPRPLILGLAKNDSKISLIIDGIVSQEAWVKNRKSGTASFAIRPIRNLKPGGHIARAMAFDKNGKQSFSSRELIFGVQAAYVSATLFPPILSDPGTPQRPLITGVARNGSVVNFYINNKWSQSIRVGYSKTGVAGFKWQPKEDLSDGTYSITSQAIGPNSQKSRFSNIVFVKVAGAGEQAEAPAKPVKPKTGAQKKQETKEKPTIATSVLPGLGQERVSVVVGLVILGILILAFLLWIISKKPPQGTTGKGPDLPSPPPNA